MATAIISTPVRVGVACLLIYATNAVAASCPAGLTEPTVKLEAPFNNVINYQLGYPTTPPSPLFITLTASFADKGTKLVNVKPSGGVYIEDSMHSVEVGSCFPHDFPLEGVGIDANRTCQLYFNINPQLIRKPGYYEGTIAVTYNLAPYNVPNPGCSGSGQATTTVRVSIQPPHDLLVLTAGYNASPISAKVGESKVGILGVAPGKGKAWWTEPGLSDVIFRSHISIEPSSENNAANPADFTLDPGSLQAAGIGMSPQFETYKWGDAIKLIFKPSTTPKGGIPTVMNPSDAADPSKWAYKFRVNVVLVSKVCLDASHIDDCLPEQKHVLGVDALVLPADVPPPKDETEKGLKSPPKDLKQMEALPTPPKDLERLKAPPERTTPPKGAERMKALRAQELKKIPAPEAKACWRYSCRNEPRRSRVTCLPRGQFPPGYGVRGACTWQRI